MLHDRSNVMALGAVWCPHIKSREINLEIRNLKSRFGLSPKFEIKWTKVSNGRLDFYSALVDYFFDNPDLFLRVLVVPDKSKLRHEDFTQNHDEWYYKMYFDMLKIIFDPGSSYNIYLDIKDTRSASKIKKLHEVLCNNIYDFSRGIIQKVQTVRSEELNILQLADFFIGAVNYANRGLMTNSAKLEIIKRIRERSQYRLTSSTLFLERKVNIFVWQGREE
jgi:hypothetical protein